MCRTSCRRAMVTRFAMQAASRSGRRGRRVSIARALALRSFDAQDIAWQVEVIRQNTAGVSRSDGPAPVAAKASRVLRSRRDDCARQGDLPCGSRQDRRRPFATCHPPGSERGLDRSRLAGRFRGCPARAARCRSLQRPERHRDFFSPPTPRRGRASLQGSWRWRRSRTCAGT